MKQAELHNTEWLTYYFAKKILQSKWFAGFSCHAHSMTCRCVFSIFFDKCSSKLLLQSLYWLVFKWCFLPVFIQYFRKVMFAVSLFGRLPLVAKLICENDDESNLYQLHYFGFKWKSHYELKFICRKLDLCDKCEILNVIRNGYEHRLCWSGLGKVVQICLSR